MYRMFQNFTKGSRTFPKIPMVFYNIPGIARMLEKLLECSRMFYNKVPQISNSKYSMFQKFGESIQSLACTGDERTRSIKIGKFDTTQPCSDSLDN